MRSRLQPWPGTTTCVWLSCRVSPVVLFVPYGNHFKKHPMTLLVGWQNGVWPCWSGIIVTWWAGAVYSLHRQQWLQWTRISGLITTSHALEAKPVKSQNHPSQPWLTVTITNHEKSPLLAVKRSPSSPSSPKRGRWWPQNPAIANGGCCLKR